eukprot:scaffold329625_cov76-Tisochrysis_lutea.AAC.1
MSANTIKYISESIGEAAVQAAVQHLEQWKTYPLSAAVNSCFQLKLRFIGKANGHAHDARILNRNDIIETCHQRKFRSDASRAQCVIRLSPTVAMIRLYAASIR